MFSSIDLKQHLQFFLHEQHSGVIVELINVGILN
jgi:hypothetical protein